MDLTKAEEQVMQILWKLEKAFVKEIVDQIKEPKPAYNTISTIVRILEKKQFVSHVSFGKTHQYFPIVEKSDYKSSRLRKMLDGYFNQSYGNLVSFFSKEDDLSLNEMEEIKQLMEEKISIIKNRKWS